MHRKSFITSGPDVVLMLHYLLIEGLYKNYCPITKDVTVHNHGKQPFHFHFLSCPYLDMGYLLKEEDFAPEGAFFYIKSRLGFQTE